VNGHCKPARSDLSHIAQRQPALECALEPRDKILGRRIALVYNHQSVCVTESVNVRVLRHAPAEQEAVYVDQEIAEGGDDLVEPLPSRVNITVVERSERSRQNVVDRHAPLLHGKRLERLTSESIKPIG